MFRRLLLATLFAVGAVHAADLPEPIGALLQAAHIPPEGAGIVVLRGDSVLVSHNAQQSMQPASTMKLFTTLTALEQFGPAFRGRTEFRSGADVVNGVLQGDLIVRGGGDVDLNEDVLLHMLQALRNQGIQKIKGDVVLDRQLFQPARPDVGQPPFDEFPWAYYNVIPDALLTNTNLLKVEMRSTGSKVALVMMPEMDKVGIRSDLKLIDAPCAAWEAGWRSPDVSRSGGRIEVVLHGSFPKNCIKSTSVDVLDHHDYLERLLRASWRKLGGSIGGEVREASGAVAPGRGRHRSRHHGWGERCRVCVCRRFGSRRGTGRNNIAGIRAGTRHPPAGRARLPSAAGNATRHKQILGQHAGPHGVPDAGQPGSRSGAG